MHAWKRQPGMHTFASAGGDDPSRRPCGASTPAAVSCALTRKDADPMLDDLPVTDLVRRARNGNKQAWDALVDRYAPLIWSICRRSRLSRADATDVGQRIWQQLVDQLATIRDPAAIPGWLATSNQQECRRIRSAAHRPHAGGQALHAGNIPARQIGTAEQELLVTERNAALRAAFGHLPPVLPAAARLAHRAAARAVRRNQRHAGHPSREHRAVPRPLPGDAASRSGNSRPDQRRRREHDR